MIDVFILKADKSIRLFPSCFLLFRKHNKYKSKNEIKTKQNKTKQNKTK